MNPPWEATIHGSIHNSRRPQQELMQWVAHSAGVAIGVVVLLAIIDFPLRYQRYSLTALTVRNISIAVAAHALVRNEVHLQSFRLGYLSAMQTEACEYLNYLKWDNFDKAAAVRTVRESANEQINTILGFFGVRPIKSSTGCYTIDYSESVPQNVILEFHYGEWLFLFENLRHLLPLTRFMLVQDQLTRMAVELHIPCELVPPTEFDAVYMFLFGTPWSLPAILLDVREHGTGKSPSALWIYCVLSLVASWMGGVFTYIPRIVAKLSLPITIEWLNRSHIRTVALLVFVSFVIGAASVALFGSMLRTIVIGTISDIDVAIVLSLGLLLALATSASLYCRRILAKGYQSRAFPTTEFVLFLRSFASDGSQSDQMAAAVGIRQWTEEEELAELLAGAGPFVACKDPARDVPRLGGIQIDLRTQWSEQISEAIRRARVIIIRIGTTAGVAWELQRIDELGAESKTLFVIPEKSPVRVPLAERPFLNRHRVLNDSIELNLIRILRWLRALILPVRDTSNPRFRFLGPDGKQIVCYRHVARNVGWFSRFQRATDIRRALQPFARTHGFVLSYDSWHRDLLRDILCICVMAWFVWWQVIYRMR